MADWLEKAIGTVSPRLALQRARARAALRVVRSYEAGKVSRRTGGWKASGAAANSEIVGDLARLQARSRELVRNNPYGRKAIETFVANAVGTGILPNWGRYQPLWDRWSETCDADGKNDFSGLQTLIGRTVFESGECLVRYRSRRATSKVDVPLQLQVLEPDYLDVARTGPVVETGGFRIAGVEFNGIGQRVGYWLFPQHPGDLTIYRRTLSSRFVPASQVEHIYEVLRPGQVRGVPRMAASMVKMRDLDDYEEAELVRKKIEACFAVFVVSPDPETPIGTEAGTAVSGARVEALEPGMISYTRPGEDVRFGAPSQNAEYAGYTESQLHAIAAGCGITFEQLTGNYNTTNRSSARASMVEFRRLMATFQWQTFVPQMCVPIARNFAALAQEFSGLPSNIERPVLWTAPRWESTDPEADVNADKEAIKGGMKTLSESLRERGYDPGSVFSELGQEREALRKLGVVVDTDVGASAGAAPGAKAPSRSAPEGADLSVWSERMSERREIPMQQRLAEIRSVNPEARTVDMVWSTGAQVRRSDFWSGRQYFEELSLDPKHVDMARLQAGAPLLDSHSRYGVNSIIGVVEAASVDGKTGTATVRFSKREDVEPIFRDVQDGIIRNVSVGYSVSKYEIAERANDLPIYRAVAWQPMEISLVAVGADAKAQLRGDEQRTNACEFSRTSPSAAADIHPERTEMSQVAAVAAAPTQAVDQDAIRAEAVAAERARVKQIRDVADKLRMPDLAQVHIDSGATAEAARDAIWEARLAQENNSRSVSVQMTGADPVDVRRELMAEAIHHRIAGGKISDGARQYRHMSLLRAAEESLAAAKVNVRGLSGIEIAGRALHSTSDFPYVLANVMNKRLRQAYDESQPSYRVWARRAPNAPDFKNIQVTALGNAPDLALVNEGGEYTYGTIGEGKEVYAVATYGKIVAFTRQALVNDDLRAFDRIVSSFGNAAARLENRLVYTQLTSNPTLNDGVALFEASTHLNYTSSGTAISNTSLAVARALMRKQKGLASEELNIAPSYLIVPATQEQLAYQYTSSNYVPAKASDVNEFRQGGKTALEVVVEAYLDASSTTAWYLAANAGQIDTVEYCFLDGSEGVYIENDIGFDIDGMKVKARLDFAAKATEYRGLYKNVGA